jgi:hypothetical protein
MPGTSDAARHLLLLRSQTTIWEQQQRQLLLLLLLVTRAGSSRLQQQQQEEEGRSGILRFPPVHLPSCSQWCLLMRPLLPHLTAQQQSLRGCLGTQQQQQQQQRARLALLPSRCQQEAWVSL